MPSRATQRRSTTPNATFGSHLARFARPDCATEPVRIVPSNPSSVTSRRSNRRIS